MKTNWTKWAAAYVQPVRGKPWTLDVNLKKAEKSVPGVPAKPTLAEEVARAVKLRVNERYGPDGNHPKGTAVRDFVDVLVARAGVAFATQVLIEACAKGQLPTATYPRGRDYLLRHDGQPWRRLREHLAVASPAEVAAAKKVATAGRKRKGEVPPALAYAFCEPSWVKQDLPGMFENGYGQHALLAAISDAKTARAALVRLLEDEDIARYQLVEEAYPHVPNLMMVLGDKDATLIKRALERGWNNKTRKPWQELYASIGKK